MPKTYLPVLFLFFGVKTFAQTLQLSPPQTAAQRLFASPDLEVSFDFRLQGAEIRYTTDGSEPSASSAIYSSPLKTTNRPGIVKAKAFKAGFLPSETTLVQILPYQNLGFDSIGIAPAPKKYTANGWETLSDRKLGDADFKQDWLGFDSTEIDLTLFFSKKKTVSELAISFLRQQKSWIFLPSLIQIYDKKGNLLASQSLPDEYSALPNSMEIINLNLPKRRHKSLIIKIIAFEKLPTWHSGAGLRGWMFLDEIMAW